VSSITRNSDNSLGACPATVRNVVSGALGRIGHGRLPVDEYQGRLFAGQTLQDLEVSRGLERAPGDACSIAWSILSHRPQRPAEAGT